MGIGSYTDIKLYGNKKDLDKIFNYGNNANEGDFYLRVFDINDEAYNNFTDKEYHDFLEKVGVNSLVQATCSARYERRKNNPYVSLDIYSVYETPIGCWKKIAEEFPEIEGFGHVVREDDYEGTAGEITIKNGEVEYIAPEEMYDEDENESD